MNEGVDGGVLVPDKVLLPIFKFINQTFFPELAITSTKGGSDGDAAAGGAGDGAGCSSILSSSANLEGWTEIVGSGFPRPKGLTGVKTVTYQHVSNIFSEVTNSSSVPAGSFSLSGDTVPGAHAEKADVSLSGKMDDHTWLSLCCGLLFFSASPSTGAPYAFVDVRRVKIANVDIESSTLTLTGDSVDNMHIVVVLLLLDGRWQELKLVQLELRMPTAAELDSWSQSINASIEGQILPTSGIANIT